MVMKLPAPLIDSVAFVRDVVAERRRGVNGEYFIGLENEWCARVQTYIDAAGVPPGVATWPAIEPRKPTFLNLYLSPAADSAQSRMLKILRQHELTVCPACGELGRPNTLDHFLPKDLYPHFCITPVNLFPMCDACQLAKGTKVGDAQSPRFFIHPYFDAFVGEQVLKLDIHAPFHTPAFTLTPVDALAPPDRELIESHIRELRIEARYANFFRNEYRRLLRLVNHMRNSDQNVAAVLQTFKNGAALPSPNTWEHIFYASAVGNVDLIEYLENSPLPLYL